MISAALFLALASMQLESSDFQPGGAIPVASMADGCGGSNRSPSLSWSGAPAQTKSFALIVHDPDAPMPGGFYHWVLYDIPATVHQLEHNVTPDGAVVGLVSTGNASYHGPCPPPGPAHHYVFELYALDIARLPADTPLQATDLQRRIAGHVLASATLVGMESHQ